MIPIHWILEASFGIAPYIRKTPLFVDPKLDFYLKWENHQVTGSFKARGAFNIGNTSESVSKDLLPQP